MSIITLCYQLTTQQFVIATNLFLKTLSDSTHSAQTRFKPSEAWISLVNKNILVNSHPDDGGST